MKPNLWLIVFCSIVVISGQCVCSGQDEETQPMRQNNGREIENLPFDDLEVRPVPESSLDEEDDSYSGESQPTAISPAAASALNLLFGNRKIQKEIELTRSQLDDLRKIQEEMERETGPLIAQLRESTIEMRSDGRDEDQLVETSAELKKLQDDLAIGQAKFHQQIKEILLPHQIKWLQQAVTQMRARNSTPTNQSVLMSEHLVGALGITGDQLKAMQQIAKESQQELEEIIALHRIETHRELLEVLSQEQRDTFSEIFGEKIDD